MFLRFSKLAKKKKKDMGMMTGQEWSVKLTLSTLCSGELKTDINWHLNWHYLCNTFTHPQPQNTIITCLPEQQITNLFTAIIFAHRQSHSLNLHSNEFGSHPSYSFISGLSRSPLLLCLTPFSAPDGGPVSFTHAHLGSFLPGWKYWRGSPGQSRFTPPLKQIKV